MEVFKVLRMNEGVGDTSYAQNSLLQKQVIMMTKPITEEAMTNLYYKISPKRLSIADLGCSSGPNALFAVSKLIKTVEEICLKEGQKSPDYQVFLNDLPGNDFNTIFRSLNSFKDNIGGSSCFFTGVPGSFYGSNSEICKWWSCGQRHMASTSAHLTISNFKFKLSFSQSFELNSLKPTSLSHLKSFGGLVAASKMIKLSARSVETSPFRSAHHMRRLTVLPDEEDQFDTYVFKGLSEFCSVFMAEDFEPIINSLSKWLITIYFIVVLAWRSDAKCLWGATGCFVNAKICGILKHIFKQERPASTLKSDPGMPSSHAQSIFYIFMTSNLSVVERLGVNEVTLIMTGLTMACGSFFSWLRVSQHFHTMSQVVVGAFAGSIVSILWFWAWDAIVLEAFISFWWVRTIVIVGAISFFFGIILEAMQHLHSQKQ